MDCYSYPKRAAATHRSIASIFHFRCQQPSHLNSPLTLFSSASRCATRRFGAGSGDSPRSLCSVWTREPASFLSAKFLSTAVQTLLGSSRT